MILPAATAEPSMSVPNRTPSSSVNAAISIGRRVSMPWSRRPHRDDPPGTRTGRPRPGPRRHRPSQRGPPEPGRRLHHLNAEAAIPALLARDFDLVLSESYPGNPAAPHPGVTTSTLVDDPLLLAVPATWTAHDLADLAGAPWVMEHAGSAPRTWATATCRAAGFEPTVRYETADLLLHAAIVARGHAAAFLPRLAHRPDPAIRLIPTEHARVVTLSTRTGSSNTPAIQAFTAAITAAR